MSTKTREAGALGSKTPQEGWIPRSQRKERAKEEGTK
jgi:hypothetical protein